MRGAAVGVIASARSGTFPQATLAAWWAADDLGYADDASVTSWAGRVGPTLSEATYSPVFKTNILNGLPCVRFTANGVDRLSTGSGAYMRNVSGGQIFAVTSTTGNGNLLQTHVAIERNASNSDRFTLYSSTATENNYLGIAGRRLDGDSYAEAWSTTSAPSSPAGVVRATRDYAAGTVSIHVDGVASSLDGTSFQTAGNTSDTDSNAIRLGASASLSNALDGDIFEVLVYNSVLSTADIAAVESYLEGKYAL